MPNIKNIKELQFYKAQLKSRIKEEEKQIESRISGLFSFTKLLQSPKLKKLTAFTGVPGDTAFNLIYDLIIGLRAGRLGFLKSVLWQIQASFLREPLRIFWEKLTSVLGNWETFARFKSGGKSSSEDYEPHDPYADVMP